MTPRFLDFIPFIFKWEGGYTNDPDDPGGETNFGIDKRSHPHVDIKHLTKEGARQIYWDLWLKHGIDSIAPQIGEVVFNCDVNAGQGRTTKIVAAVNRLGNLSNSESAKAFLDEQDAFYRRLAAARPASRKFLVGWLNRTADLRKTLGL